MREAECISFSIARVKHLDQKQLEGRGEVSFLLAHRLQSITERSQDRNSSRDMEEYCLLACFFLLVQPAFL